MVKNSVEVLRCAAVMVVLSLLDESSIEEDVGRRSGTAWAQDHRLMNSGQTGLMRKRSQRSIWR